MRVDESASPSKVAFHSLRSRATRHSRVVSARPVAYRIEPNRSTYVPSFVSTDHFLVRTPADRPTSIFRAGCHGTRNPRMTNGGAEKLAIRAISSAHSFPLSLAGPSSAHFRPFFTIGPYAALGATKASQSHDGTGSTSGRKRWTG